MLRTNSKKAKQNIKNHIMDVFNDYVTDCGSYPENAAATLADAAAVIFQDVKRVLNIKHNNYVSQADFTRYAAMLPGYVETFYNAWDALKTILEETDAEAARYTNADAEKVLTAIVYRELINAVLRPYDNK